MLARLLPTALPVWKIHVKGPANILVYVFSIIIGVVFEAGASPFDFEGQGL